MGNTHKIKEIYSQMETSKLVERLASGEVSDQATAIGYAELRSRGLDAEKVVADAFRPLVGDDVSEIKGKSVRMCPFCGSRSVRGYWSATCTKCAAVYHYSIFERLIVVVAVVWTAKAYRSGNELAFWAGICFLIALAALFVIRGTTFGTWNRISPAANKKTVEDLYARIESMNEHEKFISLLSAIRRGNLIEVEPLLKSVHQLTAYRDSEGRSALSVAVNEGMTEIASLILKSTDCGTLSREEISDLVRVAERIRNRELANLLKEFYERASGKVPPEMR